jgi:NAD(P)-dependent dehydrogenase (short-subunit alcohol dehydrogenase family)
MRILHATMAFNLINPSRHDVYPFIDPKENLKGAAAGKSVLITGAGTGIGIGIAQAFALAGAERLFLAARRAEPLEKTKESIKQLAPQCEVTVLGGSDVSDQSSVEKMFQTIGIVPDVVVSNAGVATIRPLVDSDPETWMRDFNVNVRGTHLVAREFLRALRASGESGKGRRIINISSNSSWRKVPGQSSYGSSKIAVNRISEYIDIENASHFRRSIRGSPPRRRARWLRDGECWSFAGGNPQNHDR